MSRDIQERFRNPARTLAFPAKNKPNYQREVEKLNARLKRLSTKILNPHPYLLTVPSDVPYRHSSRFVNTWHVGTPFAPEEEQLQYISFLSHQDVGEELLRVNGAWSDDKGNILDESDESPRNIATSGRNTPLDPHRKKISLTDYKSKSKVTNTPTNGKQPQYSKDQVDGLATNGPHTGTKERPGHPPVVHGKKRPLEENVMKISNMDGPSSPVGSMVAIQESPGFLRPIKQERIFSTSSDDTPVEDFKWQETIQPIAADLPGLLSPTLPSSDKDKNLPELVSPTLPPSIVKYLSSQSSQSQADASFDHQRTEPVRSILASAGFGLSPNSGPKKSPKSNNLAAGHVRSDSQHSIRSNVSTASAVLGVASPGLKGSARTPLGSGTPLQSAVRSSPGPRQRHIIALKYGKKNRKRVEGLLKFAPRPKKSDIRKAAPSKLESVSSTGKPGTGDDNIRPKKRPLEESPDIASKRPKSQPASLLLNDKPSTPIPTAFMSPSIQPGALQPKSVFSTPKKELKSSAMQRVASSDGVDIRTPPGDRARLSTPLSMERSVATSKGSPPPTSAPSTREDDRSDRSAWQSLDSKYYELGRTIKREATLINQNAEQESTERSPLAVVLFIEALLCFMINVAARSQSQRGGDPDWPTIIPYHLFVFREARRFRHLHGIVVQLGAVCRQLIHKYYMDRLARDPLPDEQVGSAPTPGSDGNTKTNEDGEKYKKKYLQFRDTLVSNSKELQVAWMSGSVELSMDTLEREYSKTWKKRAKDTSLRGVMRLLPAKIPEDYFLPLDATATPFEAVRFTVAFLEEWTEKEGVEWKTRLEI